MTVPGLGSAPDLTAPTPGVVPPGDAAPTREPQVSTGVTPEEQAGSEAPAALSTVTLDLVGCADCTVLGTHADVVAGYSVALILRGGRATLLSVDGDGAVVGAINVPYGSTFPAPPDGRLACGAGGRCVLAAAQPDGRTILSAYELGATGTWRDLSGTGGFLSATSSGGPVALEDAYGAAIQVSDGTTTVWTVLSWDGERFSSIGCAPDAPAPDLAALSLTSCLS